MRVAKACRSRAALHGDLANILPVRCDVERQAAQCAIKTGRDPLPFFDRAIDAINKMIAADPHNALWGVELADAEMNRARWQELQGRDDRRRRDTGL